MKNFVRLRLALTSTLRALSSPLFALSFFLTATPAHAQKTKPELTAQIDATRQTYEDIALKIWGYAEIGYKETQGILASDQLCTFRC